MIIQIILTIFAFLIISKIRDWLVYFIRYYKQALDIALKYDENDPEFMKESIKIGMDYYEYHNRTRWNWLALDIFLTFLVYLFIIAKFVVL